MTSKNLTTLAGGGKNLTSTAKPQLNHDKARPWADVTGQVLPCVVHWPRPMTILPLALATSCGEHGPEMFLPSSLHKMLLSN